MGLLLKGVYMILLFQSDDYGITRAVSQGIIYSITHGIVRNTGLFANMPWAEECVEWIRPYLDDIAFGIDLNASTGPSLLGYDKVPNLCHENGMFYTSRENRAMDTAENNYDHVNYEQVYAEFEAQTERFIALVGKAPDYIHGHAYGSKTTEKARRAIAEKYNRPLTADFREPYKPMGAMSWYTGKTPEEQLNNDPLGYITSDKGGLLNQELGYIITHCGWCDKELFELSSYNTCRAVDLAAATSDEIKAWVKDNDIELITFKDLR